MTTETQVQTIQDFLTKHPVGITLQDAPTNPAMDDSDKMLNYYVTLEREGRHMSLYFSTGVGWVEKRKGTSKEFGNASMVSYDKKYKRFVVNDFSSRKTEVDKPMQYRIRKPAIADVLDCLASDASGVENARDFEDWASDYGYDTDSRKAHKTFETCQRQAKELQTLLGREAFKELLQDTERL